MATAFKLVSLVVFGLGCAALSVACAGADAVAPQEEAHVATQQDEDRDLQQENAAEALGNLESPLITVPCQPWNCPLPRKVIDCRVQPQCEECCTGLSCVYAPCCNPYLNTCESKR
jgi:hypothetical protein